MAITPALEFYKMTGAGNDFVVLNGFDSQTQTFLKMRDRKKLAQQVCKREYFVGSDGLVIVEPSSNCDFKWDFYNSDGSSAEMCGNAARCVGLFYFKKIVKKDQLSLETLAGTVRIEINSDSTISVEMPMRQKHVNLNKSIEIEGLKISGAVINTGVPHFVVESANDDEQIKKRSRQIRMSKEFQPTGTNVTFYRELGAGVIESVSYERGVEDFTLACGTGAVAAAMVYKMKKPQSVQEIKVVLPGGTVFVSENKESGHPILRGTAMMVFHGELSSEAFNEKI